MKKGAVIIQTEGQSDEEFMEFFLDTARTVLEVAREGSEDYGTPSWENTLLQIKVEVTPA